MRFALAAAFLAVASHSFASPADVACAGTGPGKQTGCGVLQAEQTFSGLRTNAGKHLQDAAALLDAALSLRPQGAPAPQGDFNVYFARLTDAEDEFSKPSNFDAVRAARGKWDWAFVRLREPLRSDGETLGAFPALLDADAASASSLRSVVEQALAPIAGGSGDGLDDLRSQGEKLEKRLRDFGDSLTKGPRPELEKAGGALRTLLNRFDADDAGLKGKLDGGIYSNDSNDDPARAAQIQAAETHDAKDLRQARDEAFDQVKKARDAVAAWDPGN